jgi:flagellar basal-body rod protein FlgB
VIRAELDLETPSVQVIGRLAPSYNYFYAKKSGRPGRQPQIGKEMIDKLDSALRFHQEALNLRARRQEVLSANIAHADTPNFKARDFDFSASLSQAVERGREAMSVSMATTSSRHIAGEAQAGGDAALLYRTPNQSSLDGNTVEMDVERVNFADNAMRYEANLTILGSKIKSLLSAVQ